MSDAVDAVQKERDAWANAIRTVARGAIPSPEAARAAITELLIALERKGLASDAYLAKCEAADKAEERASELRVALQDARELAEAGWSYADSYYREKWDYEKRLAELDAVLQVTTQKIEHVGDQGQFLAITGGKPCKK